MRRANPWAIVVFSVTGIGTACSADDEPSGGNQPSTGGAGGMIATGGAPSTGGVVAGTGGVATGGAVGAGGGPANGGAVSTGGASSTGGMPNTGGMPGTGGTSSGGASTSGGAASTGGATGATGETGRLVGMVDAHNAVRAAVETSNPLPNVTWSPQVAAIAQAYADQLAASGCGLVHSMRPGYGENLAYIGGGTDTAQHAVELWAGEGQCYEFGQFLRTDTCTCPCSGNNCCGHYTQMVWRSSTTIGCGVASCSRGGSVWVCNYQPQGNIVGQNPY